MPIEPIKQEELKAFYERKLAFEKEEDELKKLKQNFADRKGMGAETQPGPFDLIVTQVAQNRVNDKLLIEAIAKDLGSEKAEAYKAAATKKTEYNTVSVKLVG